MACWQWGSDCFRVVPCTKVRWWVRAKFFSWAASVACWIAAVLFVLCSKLSCWKCTWRHQYPVLFFFDPAAPPSPENTKKRAKERWRRKVWRDKRRKKLFRKRRKKQERDSKFCSRITAVYEQNSQTREYCGNSQTPLMFRLVSKVKLEFTHLWTWVQLTAEVNNVNSGYCPFWPKDAILFIHR